jgi:hypothetical protein
MGAALASHALVLEPAGCMRAVVSHPLPVEPDSCDLYPASHPLPMEPASCEHWPVSHPLSEQAHVKPMSAVKAHHQTCTRPPTAAFRAELAEALHRERAELQLEFDGITYTFEPAHSRRVPALPDLLFAFAKAERSEEGISHLNSLLQLLRCSDEEFEWFDELTPHTAAAMLADHEAAAAAAAVAAAAALAASRTRWAKRAPGAPRPCITAVAGGVRANGLVEDALFRNFRASPAAGFKVFIE